MHVPLLILLTTICISAGGYNGYDSNFLYEGPESVGDGIEALLERIFNTTHVLSFHERLAMIEDKIRRTLELTPRMIVSLNDRLAKLRPIRHVRVNEMGDSISEINEKSRIGDYLFQGDIVLTDDQIEDIKEDVEEETSGMSRRKRQAYKDWRYPQTIWSKGVNYYFDNSASDRVRSVFRRAAKEWESGTCINIKENPRAEDRIRVFPEDGCWSFVGRRGREQDLSLGRGCETIGTAAHELGHALGMFHTMSRHDRDKFITLNTRNIRRDWLDQFAKQTPHTNENYGITYDYGSIMHYGGTSASINGMPTMVPFDTTHQETLGSPFISFYDLLMMNTHYKCLDKCKKVATPCENGGIPHPRNCSRCLCPGGYGGRLCNERVSTTRFL
ncbi:hypothetical protein Y032_0091g2469 [Ancylostoma ceylanicum]|uniref:Metalloendopeptidase n=1 Tax=Ancylostoma ceylanicum TaxID=53326 RepID=A0A016TMD8_9BILA|nr:hypothetical protein Y032_0091g2469 [Ancylostoma ceylanicum]